MCQKDKIQDFAGSSVTMTLFVENNKIYEQPYESWKFSRTTKAQTNPDPMN